MNEIVMIPLDDLMHHPDNPRKDLGDLTELAESIQAQGILQNLTVVQDIVRNKYVVVIGNRRMEAAKLAGLDEVPCVISTMDAKEQMATMLSENMHRTDLTPYEQAEGFQMMMDLGFTEKEIGEKTGFSTKTVKDRLKLTKLNKKEFGKAVQQGATLIELIEITKLDSKTAQKEVLEAAGTANFRQKMMNALDDQERKKNQERLKPLLKEAGFEAMPEKERYDHPGWEEIWDSGISINDDDAKFTKCLKKIQKDNEGPFRYYFTNYGRIEIYKVKAKANGKKLTDEEKTERQKSIARGKHKRYVMTFWAQAYELRKDFVKNYSVANGQSASTLGKIMVRYALSKKPGWDGKIQQNHDWDDAYLWDVLGLPEKPEELPDQEDVKNSWDKKYKTVWQAAEEKNVPMVRIMLAWAVAGGVFWPDSPERGLYDSTDGTYENPSNRDSDMTRLYEFLKEIGYGMSDMETQLLDGTHECYQMEDL